MASRFRAVLFDLDRTLVDVQSFTDYGAAWGDLEAAGLTAHAELPSTNWDRPTIACMAALAALAGTADWQEASRLVEAHERAAIGSSRRMPGVDEVLGAVTGRPAVVVTLMGESAARAALAHHAVPLEQVVGRRPDLRPKPAPDQLLAACTQVGVDPAETVMIGDSTWDAVAARAAGMAFVGITNGGPDEFAAEPGASPLAVVTDLAGAATLL